MCATYSGFPQSTKACLDKLTFKYFRSYWILTTCSVSGESLLAERTLEPFLARNGLFRKNSTEPKWDTLLGHCRTGTSVSNDIELLRVSKHVLQKCWANHILSPFHQVLIEWSGWSENLAT